MRPFGTLLSAALLAVALASCNTTEALTPQANVGGGGARSSSPVTQAETDRMARSAQPETYNSRGGYQSGPQNTLEAQARALESGNAVSPSSSGPPPQWQGQQQQPPMQQPETAAAPPQQQLRQQQSASPQTSAASGPTVRFLPIIGAPVQAVTPLSRRSAPRPAPTV